MIQRLTESFISSVELLEAEGRLAKRHAADFVVDAVAVVSLTIVALLGGIAALTGVVVWITPVVGLGPALLLCGGGGFALSAWWAQRAAKRLRDGSRTS